MGLGGTKEGWGTLWMLRTFRRPGDTVGGLRALRAIMGGKFQGNCYCGSALGSLAKPFSTSIKVFIFHKVNKNSPVWALLGSFQQTGSTSDRCLLSKLLTTPPLH